MPLIPPFAVVPTVIKPDFEDGDIVIKLPADDDTIDASRGNGRIVLSGVVTLTGAYSSVNDVIEVDWENDYIGVPNGPTS